MAIDGIDLASSYVLTLVVEPYRLKITADFCLDEAHPLYAAQPQGSRCYRRGTLQVGPATRIAWSMSGLQPALDAAGETDWGCIDRLEAERGRWLLEGDFGSIEIEGGAAAVIL